MLFAKRTIPLAFALSLLSPAPPAWSGATTATRPLNPPQCVGRSTFSVDHADDGQKYLAQAFCTPYQRCVEEVAWRGALQYAQALARWQPNSKFQPAMDFYMGTDSRGQLSTTIRGMG